MFVIPIAIFWILAIWGLFSPRPVLIYLFFGTMSFGSMAVLPPAMTAGLTFTPTPIVALLIALRTLAHLKGLNFTIASALMPKRGLLLFLFWVVATLTTIFMPRIFIGQIEIIPVRGTLNASYPLYPTPQNISQLAYLTISVITVVAFARLLQNESLRRHALMGVFVGGCVAVGTGFLDFASQYAPITPLLEPFRTATYALLTDVEVLGAKRVIGLMPEASTYGNLCLNFLCMLVFLRHWVSGRLVPSHIFFALIGGLTLFCWLSTSSSTYVALVMLLGLLGGEWFWRAYSSGRDPRRGRGLVPEFWLAFSGVFALLAVIFVAPSLLDPITAMFDRMVLQKTTSHSFEERNMWTAVSLQAMIDTYGIGVGVGSTRPSNALVAVLSSTGVVGALLFYGFLLQLLARRAHPSDSEGTAIVSAVRWAFLPLFTVNLLVGTSADFGAFWAFQFGLLMAIGIRGDTLRQRGGAPAPSPPPQSTAPALSRRHVSGTMLR